MVDIKRDLEAFIVESEEGEEDISELHQAAWRGDVEVLQSFLKDERYILAINLRLRPFLATPLRLAASNGQVECVRFLLSRGAIVDLPDRKNQTPLFCSVKNRDLRSCKLLLESAASPEGHPGNLSTPLQLACQNGFTAGLQVLLDHGATIESSQGQGYAQLSHPLRTAATYGYLGCFISLLCFGGLTANAADSLHVICKRKRHPIFVKLWWQFGGSFWYRDSSGLLAVEISENPSAEIVRTLMGTPLSLQSQCRLKLKSSYPKMNVEKLPHSYLKEFLQYRDIFEVRAYQKLVREEINFPTGLDLEAKLDQLLPKIT